MLCRTQARGGDREKKEPAAPPLGWKEKCSGDQILVRGWHGDGQRGVLGELPGSGDFSMSIKGERLQWGQSSPVDLDNLGLLPNLVSGEKTRLHLRHGAVGGRGNTAQH